MAILGSRVFMNGNSQAVRIPREFRLDSSRVEITRSEAGDLVIHPLPVNRGSALLEALSAVFDTSRPLCVHYAAQFTRLKDAGTPIGANDLWNACHALALDATLVSNNTRVFERVTGLRVENWVG